MIIESVEDAQFFDSAGLLATKSPEIKTASDEPMDKLCIPHLFILLLIRNLVSDITWKWNNFLFAT